MLLYTTGSEFSNETCYSEYSPCQLCVWNLVYSLTQLEQDFCNWWWDAHSVNLLETVHFDPSMSDASMQHYFHTHQVGLLMYVSWWLVMRFCQSMVLRWATTTRAPWCMSSASLLSLGRYSCWSGDTWTKVQYNFTLGTASTLGTQLQSNDQELAIQYTDWKGQHCKSASHSYLYSAYLSCGKEVVELCVWSGFFLALHVGTKSLIQKDGSTSWLLGLITRSDPLSSFVKHLSRDTESWLDTRSLKAVTLSGQEVNTPVPTLTHPVPSSLVGIAAAPNGCLEIHLCNMVPPCCSV